MKYILGTNNITLFIDNRPVSVVKDTAKFAKVIEAFNLPEDEQEEAIKEILFAEPEQLAVEGFEFTPDGVKIDGEFLPEVLSNKIESLKRDKMPITLFLNFWRNLKLNPSATSINELYDFLAYKELPITEDGCFIGYRGLGEDFYSIRGNLRTKVKKGKVNSYGQIYNGVGEVIEVDRNQVDDNRDYGCSYGLHVGSLDYAKNWGRGKVVVVKVNPKDVVSVPKDCGFQKLRCCAYEVLSEFKQEITAAATDDKGGAYKDETVKRLDAFTERVDKYLLKKAKQGLDRVSIAQIRNSFSPDYPQKQKILNAITSAGWVWVTDNKSKEWVLLDQ